MKKRIQKRLPIVILPIFLLFFMLLIFGPAEIFFANVTEFEFVYGEFGGYLTLLAVGITILLSAIVIFLPDVLYRICVSLMLGLSVASYAQVMFINKQLDLLGLNPDGYQVSVGAGVANLIPWVLIVGVVTVLAFWKKQIWEKVACYASAFLLCIQAVALISLFLTAGEEAYKHPEGEWHLSGADQYTVSANENVIVFVLDYFSNQYYEPALEQYPDMTDFLHDFTYYSNTDCNYFGTFPSLAHMLTGQAVDASVPVNEWCYNIWNNENADSFYEMLKEKGYVTNLYTPDLHHLCGTNNPELLADSFSNMSTEMQEIDVFYKLLFKTMGKMSAYRMAPEILKPCFYTQGTEYGDIITYKENIIDHNNYDFYQKLISEGLQADDEANYFVVQHLMGVHEFLTGEDGFYKADATREETVKGCMVLVEEYLNQLKELGVYDDATIIITSDHGDMTDSQVVMFVKEPGEQHEQMIVSNAPITLQELRPTIAQLVGAESDMYGKTFYDFKQDELRERTVRVRWTDAEYPIIQNYAIDRVGYANVYYGYTYTGDIEDLLESVEDGPEIIEPMVDSFF